MHFSMHCGYIHVCDYTFVVVKNMVGASELVLSYANVSNSHER